MIRKIKTPWWKQILSCDHLFEGEEEEMICEGCGGVIVEDEVAHSRTKCNRREDFHKGCFPK